MVRKLKDRARARFRIPLSEVASQDTWQRIVLGFAVVGGDRRTITALRQDIARYLIAVAEGESAQLASDEHELLSYGARLGDPRQDGGGLGLDLDVLSPGQGDGADRDPDPYDRDLGADPDRDPDADPDADPNADWIPAEWRAQLDD